MATSRAFSQSQAESFAAKLDLDLDIPICLACLSFVSMAIDKGDSAEIKRALRRFTPDLWVEGLADPALAAVGRACEAGVADADRALADLESGGGRSPTARAIVFRLGDRLLRRMRVETRVHLLARKRIELAPPELN